LKRGAKVKYADTPYPENLLVEVGIDIANLPEDFSGTFEYVMSAALTERERGVIECHFRDGLSLSAIGEKYGVQKERVRQIEYHALVKFRHPKGQWHMMLEKGLRVYYQEKLEARDARFEEIAYQKGYADGFRAAKREQPYDGELTLDCLGLSNRALNALIHNGKQTVQDIASMTADDYRNCEGIGVTVTREILKKLRGFGYPVGNLLAQFRD